MTNDTTETSAAARSEAAWVLLLGAAGVLISWAYFVPSTFEHGFFESWAAAFASHPFSTGLHADLLASALIVISIACFDRKRIGTRVMWATIAAACILGVCAALPVYWIGLRKSRA